MGAPPGAEYWTVHVENPYNEQERLDSLQLRNGAYSASECAGKMFEADGREYCHIFDPKTGQPIRGVLATGAQAPTGAASDALSTAFLVMGRERIVQFCEAYPEYGGIYIGVPEGAEVRAERINL